MPVGGLDKCKIFRSLNECVPGALPWIGILFRVCSHTDLDVDPDQDIVVPENE